MGALKEKDQHRRDKTKEEAEKQKVRPPPEC